MAKYLLMTFVMNMITIMVTVVIINVYFRGPATHTMPNWVRTLFLKHLPMLLIMRRPESTEQELRRAREAKRDRRSIRGVFNAIKHQGVKSIPSNGSGDVEDEVAPLSRKRESEEVNFFLFWRPCSSEFFVQIYFMFSSVKPAYCRLFSTVLPYISL
ncbi:hypothetical protein Y032_0010g1190 [Ancylostoma ceylanicum]|nr:hypothetical protein Y032_0010g1190 [Ancylostoma ceylanicum]